jgi:hypothetical protein
MSNWTLYTFARVLSLVAATALVACTGQQSVDTQLPEQGNPDYFKVRDSLADEVYITDDVGKRQWFNGIRRIYIAPLELADMQIIQPYGAKGGERWEVDDLEQSVARKTFVREMTRAMEADQAFHIVADKDAAQAVLHARVIAIHPYRTRTEMEREGGRGAGAITMSFALVDPSDDSVAIRALDSKSTDDIWAFDNIQDDRKAIDLIFESWGYQIRRSLLFMQARLDAVQMPVLLKPQKEDGLLR